MYLLAASTSLFTTPASLRRFPSMSEPTSGSDFGIRRAVAMVMMRGNESLSNLLTFLGGFMRIFLSSLLVSIFETTGCNIGMRAM